MALGDVGKVVALVTVSAVLLGSVTHIREATAMTCADATADVTIEEANKVQLGDPKQANQTLVVDPKNPPPPPPDPKGVQLGDVIEVKITNLDKLYNKPCDPNGFVLFLNGYPIKGLKPYPPNDPKGGVLQFTLRTETSPPSWTPVLGRPPFLDPRAITVSVGFQDAFPLKPAAGKSLPVLQLNIIDNGWFVLWLILFCFMLVIFFWFALRTNIIRDGDPTEGIAETMGTYSLSKLQGAVWFFVILASYLLIGIVTGDFSHSINSTALILLGIGAGTVLGSAAIDASKNTPEARTRAHDEAAVIKVRLDEINTELQDINTRLERISSNLANKPISEVDKADLLRLKDQYLKDRADLSVEKEQKTSLHHKLTRQSENLLTDILSDANGVNFHRFQIVAWTSVLGLIFIKEVYDNLAMPVFDTTLMGLLGLSAGTYLGLKIPEPISPK